MPINDDVNLGTSLELVGHNASGAKPSAAYNDTECVRIVCDNIPGWSNPNVLSFLNLVARDGVEPPPPAFSVLR